MKVYDLAGIKSGEFNKVYWVTLWFSSTIEKNDVLHIVADTSFNAQQIKHGTDGVYLERFTQRLACYKGADSIVIGKRSVTVTLNKVGRSALKLPKGVRFLHKKADKAFTSAKAIFRKMSLLEWIKIIRIA